MKGQKSADDAMPDPGAPASADSGLFGLTSTVDQARIVIQPVPWEATTSYGQGCANGPEAIFAASHQIDLFDLETGHPYREGIVMLPVDPEIKSRSEESKKAVAKIRSTVDTTSATTLLRQQIDASTRWVDQSLLAQTLKYIDSGKIVGTLGGDHSTPFGAIAAHVMRYPDLGILHLDAHADLRANYEGLSGSHASIMYKVLEHTPVKKLVQVGLRDMCEEEYDRISHSQGRVQAFYDHEIARALEDGETFGTLAQTIVSALPRDVYLSFDIDGLDPSLCPNTGTPVPGGLTFRQAIRLMAQIVSTGRRIIGFDLVEVAPGPSGEWDANVGARLLYKMCGFSLQSQDSGTQAAEQKRPTKSSKA